MSEHGSEEDQTRLCPTCRMPISILAVKCRYCGSEVGRPRKEQETLTIKDLGGEARTQYTLSGDVQGALEAFRAEELSAQEQEKREKEAAASSSWFGRRRGKRVPSDSDFSSDGGLPELDDEHRELASISSQASAPQGAGGHEAAAPTGYGMAAKLLVAGSIAVVFLLCAYLVWFLVSEPYRGKDIPNLPAFENRALRILEQGGGILEALENAARALQVNNTPQNRDIIDTVRERVIQEVDALLMAHSWRPSTLDEASSLATKALRIDPSKRLRELRARVSAEVDAYGLVLVKVNLESNRVTFKLHNPDYPLKEETVGFNGLVQNRFKVTRISGNSVRLEDTKVPSGGGYRKLIARLLKPVEGEG